MSDYNAIMEVWRDVVGYEGLYRVSNYGRVRSLDIISKNRWGDYTRKGIMLTLTIDQHGYPSCKLWKNGNKKTIRVHRLVINAFLHKVNNKHHTNHINGNKLDNRHTNLEWCTPKENQLHAYENELRKTRGKVWIVDKNTGKKSIFSSMQQASLFMGYNRSFICHSINKKGRYENNLYKWGFVT